ncbi:hypothetical protein M422DRAFT_777009 [Sphaerobolus stellatus SS14]|nr:hypothetical protein M422DRAFT_777009 [Sphaerobolus stellatus SS14]
MTLPLQQSTLRLFTLTSPVKMTNNLMDPRDNIETVSYREALRYPDISIDTTCASTHTCVNCGRITPSSLNYQGGLQPESTYAFGSATNNIYDTVHPGLTLSLPYLQHDSGQLIDEPYNAAPSHLISIDQLNRISLNLEGKLIDSSYQGPSRLVIDVVSPSSQIIHQPPFTSQDSPPLTPSNNSRSPSELTISPITPTSSAHNIRKLQLPPTQDLDQYLRVTSFEKRGIYDCLYPGCKSKPLKPLSHAYSHVRGHLKMKAYELTSVLPAARPQQGIP